MSLRRPGLGMIAAALLAVAATVSPVARADTVASLLGNFTINQFSALSMTDGAVDVHRVIVFGQLPALRELHAADADGDGVTTQAERDAYATKLARSLADSLELTVDGARVPLQFVRAATSLPVEQGGFSLRLDLDFSAPLPGDRQAVHRVAFANRNYDGRFGWNEIVVTPSPAWSVFDTDAFANSLTGGLTEALQVLPAAGPLQERTIHLAMTAGVPPAGSCRWRRDPAPRSLRRQRSANAATASALRPLPSPPLLCHCKRRRLAATRAPASCGRAMPALLRTRRPRTACRRAPASSSR